MSWETLPSFSKALYRATYFLPNETYDQWLDRVSTAYQNDEEHGKRMKSYIEKLWFHPSTPPSSNAGTNRGLPISCFTGHVEDSKEGIFKAYDEANWLGSYGGGLGWDWSDVREIGHKVGTNGGTSSGVIPFLGVSDRATLAVSQGGNRRASQAVYMSISHPEIEEFIDLRKSTGDINRRAPNLHHGVVIPDEFIYAVINDKDWNLISPKDKSIVKTLKARKLWEHLLEVRTTLRGEPYLLFIDTVNRMSPEEYKAEDIEVSTSNLCTEITLRTDDKHSGVCCLGSINLEHWDEYSNQLDQFVADCTDYLDNILQDFIDKTENLKGFERARNGAIDERSIGLGVMGFHSLLQSKMIPFESPMAKGLNLNVFTKIKEAADKHNKDVNKPCPMSQRVGSLKRNIHVTAIAPTMSISSLCGVTSSGIEPWLSNTYTKKVKQGSFPIKNKYLDTIINDKALTDVGMSKDVWVDKQWKSIQENNGSVQHLDWMDQNTKDVFKTAFEIDQRYVIEYAADRQPFIDQAQSINLFVKGGSSTQYISDLHILAWKKGVKSLYYLRSSATNRASTSTNERKKIQVIEPDECLSCQ